MPGKCVFKSAWLSVDEYAPWLVASSSKYSARCKLCGKDFNISNMGEHGLKSHMTGKKHQSLCKAKEASKFVFASTGITSSSSSTNSTSISTCFSGTECLDAEIRWAMKVATSNYSFNSCKNLPELFKDMFPDSKIATQFSCGATKVAYLICFGIAPCFKSALFKCLDEAEQYTLMFDETLNTALQTKQMDVHFRFWHPDLQLVKTQYLTSVFMGHGTAEDLLTFFRTATDNVNLSKVVQLSMDGPAVNKKFYRLLEEELNREFLSGMINVGTCSLHTINNSFKHGVKASTWDIDGILSSLYFLFKDSPARRQDFLELSKMKKMPKKFCNHRWLENVPTAERALEIWDDVKDYVEHVKKGKFRSPTCKSFHAIVNATTDLFFTAKLNVFLCVAKLVCPFLEKYQDDSPLLPFLAEDIKQLILDILTMFNVSKSEIMCEIKTVSSILRLNFMDNSFYSDISKLSLGFVADRILRQSNLKDVNSGNVKKLKIESRTFVCTMLENIVQKSPVNNQFVRDLSSLDPRIMASSYHSCYLKFKRILTVLVSKKKLEAGDCDGILLNYKNFILDVAAKSDTFRCFDHKEQRLDTFIIKYLDVKPYTSLWKVFKLLMIFSHGQASVERGFSINRQMEIENLKEETYIAKRVIKEYIINYPNFIISKELRSSAANARQRYLVHLDEQKRQRAGEQQNNKRKHLEDELGDLKAKKARIEKSIAHLTKSADELATRAEAEHNFNLISESNSFRKTASSKAEELESIDKEIKDIFIKITTM